MEITQQLVQELFDYKDGFLYWKISYDLRIKVGAIASHLIKKENRYSVCINGKRFYQYRIIFLWHYGYLPKEVDHKDRNPSNDRIENLRAATRAENMRNRTSAKGSSSKYLGVRYRKQDRSWESYIKADGRVKSLGCHKTEDLAALAYNIAASLYYGEFANLNIIVK